MTSPTPQPVPQTEASILTSAKVFKVIDGLFAFALIVLLNVFFVTFNGLFLVGGVLVVALWCVLLLYRVLVTLVVMRADTAYLPEAVARRAAALR